MRVPSSDDDSGGSGGSGGLGGGKRLYRALGVSPTATAGELKRAYHKLALRYHPDKNPGQGERFNEIAAAYTVLSDPRKKQMYDQFGDQGVQLAEAMQQQGMPPWLLTPSGRCAVCSALLGVVVIFLVLLPLLVILRADASIMWSWGIVLIPLWLANLVFAAILLLRLCARSNSDESRHSLSASQAAYLTIDYLLVLAFEILLAIKLDAEASSSASSWLSFLVCVVPLLLTFVLPTVQALYTLGHGLHHRLKPQPGIRPPTNEQLLPLVRAAVGRLLLCATIVLAALHGDGTVSCSWWLVLLPTWVQVGLLGHQWHAAFKQHQRTKDGSEEERAAKTASLVLAAVGGSLLTTCFLLLSLRLGGQAHFPATMIVSPILGLLGLIVCCGACCACLATIAHSLSQRSTGHPPYNEVRDDDSATAPSAADAADVETAIPGAVQSAVPSVGAPAPGGAETRAAGSADLPPPSELPPPRTPSAVLSGQAATAGGSSPFASANEPVLEGSWAAGSVPAPIRVDAPPSAAGSPAGPRSPAALGSAGVGSGLSVRELRNELTARGVVHDHCIEKGELEALYTRHAS